MAYTNGFDTVKVLAALFGRVGWRDQQDAPAMNAENLTKYSGRAFQDFHAAVDLVSIYQTQSDSGIADDSFNNLLSDLQKSVVMQCLTGVFDKPEVKDNTLLFDRNVYSDQEVVNDGNFVGVRFKLANNHALQVNQINLYFNGAVQFNLYLFHETKQDPIWEQTVNSSANDVVIVTPENLFLSKDEYKTGFFYLGYFQDDLGSVKAISELPCWNVSRCFGYEFVQAKKTAFERFDKRNANFSSQTFGLNMHVTCFQDNTTSVIQNAARFDNAIGLSMAVKIIEQFIHSTRSNATERVSAEQSQKLYTDLNTAGPTQEVPILPGLKSRYDKEIRRIKETFTPVRNSQIVNHADC